MYSLRNGFTNKWLMYPKYNEFIEGLNIIPFKCPLDKDYDFYLKKEDRFHFQEVYYFTLGKEKPITDVIDLMHKPKYNPTANNFFPSGVKHHSFKIPSKTIPDKKTFQAIMDLMEELIKNKKVIGIHCKHGLNRTGFIVCAFLVTKMGWDPEKAIDSFNRARGSKIIHKVYINEILSLKAGKADPAPPKISKGSADFFRSLEHKFSHGDDSEGNNFWDSDLPLKKNN